MRAQDVMTKDPACLTPNATVREAAQLMQREDVGIIPVVQEQQGSRQLLGVITDRDIAIRVVGDGKDGSTRVSDVMSRDRISTCQPSDDVGEVMNAMAKEQVRRIPIVDERGGLVGIVAQADIVRRTKDDARSERTVEEISEPRQRHSQ
ncbi:MAG TPA: CBS domain-containing protein [Gemmatimonadaceae bacterium]|nr:CBS domain-containing protein [Gemmatimonadaceae bacterium]